MYSTTRGISFRQTRYSDTSLVVRIYTEQFGLRSYLVKGARNPKSKIKPALFQPLSLIELVVSNKEKSELHHIREARSAYQPTTIHSDIRKSSILLFLNELLYKSIQEETPNPELFRFIYDNIVLLDKIEENIQDFHFYFALRLTKYLGFYPQGQYNNEGSVFDLKEGSFSDTLRVSEIGQFDFITGPACFFFHSLLNISPINVKLPQLNIPAAIRSELLDYLIRYYSYHLPLARSFKSHIILHEVLQK